MAKQQKTPQLHILVCGRSGVGKSSLINFLLGTDLCEVGDPGLSEDVSSVEGCTTTIRSVTRYLNGLEIIISDSPGLQDGHLLNEEKYLEAMYNECKDVHIILYCMEMIKVRFEPSEITAIRLLTKKFGSKFWKRCVLVLTKANSVHIPPKERQNPLRYHEILYKNFSSRFRSELKKNNVEDSICSNLRVVATGSYCANDDPGRLIPLASLECKGKQPPEQPATVDFITELWLTCLEILPSDLRVQYLQATALGNILENGKEPTGKMRDFLQRAAENLKNSIQKSDSKVQVRKNPINFNISQAERFHKALVDSLPVILAIPGAAGGAAGGAKVGAAIGAIGGVPGAVLGAAVGGAVGGVFGAVVGYGVKKYAEK